MMLFTENKKTKQGNLSANSLFKIASPSSYEHRIDCCLIF